MDHHPHNYSIITLSTQLWNRPSLGKSLSHKGKVIFQIVTQDPQTGDRQITKF